MRNARKTRALPQSPNGASSLPEGAFALRVHCDLIACKRHTRKPGRGRRLDDPCWRHFTPQQLREENCVRAMALALGAPERVKLLRNLRPRARSNAVSAGGRTHRVLPTPPRWGDLHLPRLVGVLKAHHQLPIIILLILRHLALQARQLQRALASLLGRAYVGKRRQFL